ncbi:MAG TPA: nucleotidyltransferase domain-containing protein, partial [Flavipsychrobacter sp.]|nr:nucleotidyltransferase domain-containing protein [Flavipsychrobacter sp.]
MMSSKLFIRDHDIAAGDEVLVRDSVLKTLKYFHVFRHPLYAREIYSFLQIKTSREELDHTLETMVRDESIFFAHNMYSLENSAQIFLKRLVGADMAAEKMKEARRCAAVISAFPFVKGVFVSGSLSKGYADERSDIDFFVVTAQKRLWISRTILHLFKKLTFLVNRQHSFCMNYFIDESRLCVEEK